jgi:hypothetical protein|tara:strand:+ start:322 stop:447 length:126 start_codon:yes stop_codon:yes gene_type:complete
MLKEYFITEATLEIHFRDIETAQPARIACLVAVETIDFFES